MTQEADPKLDELRHEYDSKCVVVEKYIRYGTDDAQIDAALGACDSAWQAAVEHIAGRERERILGILSRPEERPNWAAHSEYEDAHRLLSALFQPEQEAEDR